MQEQLKIKILPMQKSDVEEVMKIEEQAYGEHHWSKDSFYGELSNELAHYYSAFDLAGNLLGYAGTWRILDEAHITTIAVKPELRRKKIGEALLIRAIEDFYKNEIKYVTLEVRVSNIPAIKLYEKYGFKSLGERKGYYQNNNEDALIMWTENIFWDKFKLRYEQNVKNLTEFITVE
ncbi:MAG TPA: ribosomal protein S18-alanine N-acetyltransferase [Candidatus Gastranaerophilaceae bacterium]|nr:ribosomal protein S18-alanine N-acetyltransferase [Candidatus Gastranaerophilaceae bacterium]HPT40763.1 ribosomal protein S18-alanine N-acetyltransferase [Candidatus Gastranaerophilaceae bacterium]